MTARTIKSLLASFLVVMIGFFLVTAAFLIAFHVGRANAGTLATDVPSDPIGMIAQIYEFMRTGKGTMATGVVFTLIVWALRSGPLSGIAWFKSKVGGYTLGLGLPALTYLGAALLSGNMLTLSLILNALGAGYVAAGGWDHLQDLLGFIKNKPPVAAVTSATLLLVVVGAFACSQPGCGGKAHPIPDIIDCSKQDQTKIAALTAELMPLLAGQSVDWQAVEQRAIAAGVQIGGCVLAEIVQDYLNQHKALPADNSWSAHDALEDFRRTQAFGATFRTPKGDL